MRFFSCLLLTFQLISGFGQTQQVSVVTDSTGHRLQVNGKDFFVVGMNWDYFPIGTNYEYSLWDEPDSIIQLALDREMVLLKEMGVNAIRQYTGVPSHWIQYIYETYGIYTMLNHSFGRYGMDINGKWHSMTDYANPLVRKQLNDEVSVMAKEYHNTPGLLLFLLGNENNYGLFWEGAETEDFPEIQTNDEERARNLYEAFDEATLIIKMISTSKPVAICNGDVQFIDLIKASCRNVDIFGMNIYRGSSFGDAFEQVKKVLDKPVLLTEFGADAFDAINLKENQSQQATFLAQNWKEIYGNAAGLGKAGNSLGGFTFQFTDGWWKSGQTKNLTIHDEGASWSNGGYLFDYREGYNNMNEEWFGICAKGETLSNGTYEVKPRKAYFILKKVHQLNPYGEGVNNLYIDEFVDSCNP